MNGEEPDCRRVHPGRDQDSYEAVLSLEADRTNSDFGQFLKPLIEAGRELLSRMRSTLFPFRVTTRNGAIESEAP